MAQEWGAHLHGVNLSLDFAAGSWDLHKLKTQIFGSSPKLGLSIVGILYQ
jgi:hypothetical protein